ncbi:hypothetical protein KSS87_017177 [Heliosperma pusillum]|nr:hypothetical protein KSS87_017177 [Heliosperma pusillum]
MCFDEVNNFGNILGAKESGKFRDFDDSFVVDLWVDNLDCRWASKRRSGMTVLGKVAKVAVPKPLNLPSQRLENHGLDPNVEIVPKGTLSWGSRPSSGGSNAWATSALSPSTDGGSSSPSHLVGRPLSGGGTRPSTAGSEKDHDSNVIAWGPNSRPSSASGGQASNHTSLTSLRPHSADTRPGSAQLSRFADHSLEGSAARGATVFSERMGANEGFSLSSGDFPTLGTEKDESRMKLEPLDVSHGRPSSSSGGAKSMSDSMEISHEEPSDSDTRDYSWRKNYPPFVEDGSRPSMERWHRDPHLYQNPNIGPPHYDSWRGAPSANPPPGGVWYRGPHGPPSYGGPVPPGGFHMEPFPYYHPQNPAPGNSHPIPPGAGHHGHHPQNGDMYRPHLQEPFMRPGLPMRPGFYPGPVPFEGYYRPQMGFCNPNERDLPFMGMPAGPICNRPINQNSSDLNNSHPRSFEGRRPDQFDPDHVHDPRGNYKVLVKQNDGEYQNNKEKRSHRVITDDERGILSKAPLQENARGEDYQKRDNLGYVKNAVKDEVPFRPPDNIYHSSNSTDPKLSESVFNVEKSGTRPGIGDRGTSRDHSLIQKIEGLNAKARSSGVNAFNGEEPTERVQVVNVRAHQSLDEADTGVVLGRHYPTGRLIQGGQNRGHPHGRGNFDGQEVSRWGRKSQSHSVQLAGPNLSNDHVEDMGVPRANIEMKGDGEPAMSSLDSGDTQRAKMREIAKQRAIQLQKEEEERIREQKAKALAKLEELNRRSATHVPEAPSQKEIDPTHSAGPLTPDGSKDQSDLKANTIARPHSGFSDKTSQIDIQVVDSVDKAGFENGPSNRSVAQVYDVSKHKRAGNKSRENVLEKNLTQKQTDVGQDVLDISSENANQEATVGSKFDRESRKELPETPHVSESFAPQKRRNNRSGKNKPRVEAPSDAISSTVSLQNNSEEDNTSDLRAYSKEPDQPSGSHSSDVHGRVNNAWKGQHSRNSRPSQGIRLSEKAQSNEAVVWAPVHSHNKVEVPSQTTQKAVDPVPSSAAGESMSQSSFKSKRAEMERYVPKPGVAKELAQQGSIQQHSSLPVDHSITVQASLDSSTGNGGREKDSQRFDNRNGRSWRQRVSAESNQTHESMTVGPPNRPTELPMKGPEAITSDARSGINDSTSKSSAAFASARGHFPSGRGKRHPFKGQKSSGNPQSFEHKDSNAGLNDSHFGSERSHIEKTRSSKDSRAVMDRSAAQWQPKSQVFVAQNQPESMKPDICSGIIAHPQAENNQSAAKDRRPGSEEKSMQDMGHKEYKEEKRGPNVKGHPHPSSQVLESEIEDGRNEQRPLSGYRKNSNYGGRVNRVHESRGEWSTTAPESKQHYSSANRATQRQNSHYDYQAMETSYSSNDREPQIGSQQGNQRFKERGHSRRGRGNFYGRQSEIECSVFTPPQPIMQSFFMGQFDDWLVNPWQNVTLKLWHGGSFKLADKGFGYTGRCFKTMSVDPDELCWFTLLEEAEKCDGFRRNVDGIFYMKSGCGLKKVEDDKDAELICKVAVECRMVECYIVADKDLPQLMKLINDSVEGSYETVVNCPQKLTIRRKKDVMGPIKGSENKGPPKKSPTTETLRESHNECPQKESIISHTSPTIYSHSEKPKNTTSQNSTKTSQASSSKQISGLEIAGTSYDFNDLRIADLFETYEEAADLAGLNVFEEYEWEDLSEGEDPGDDDEELSDEDLSDGDLSEGGLTASELNETVELNEVPENLVEKDLYSDVNSDEEVQEAREKVKRWNAKALKIVNQLQIEASSKVLAGQEQDVQDTLVENEGRHSDYDNSGDEIHTPCESDEESVPGKRNKSSVPVVNEHSDFNKLR